MSARRRQISLTLKPILIGGFLLLASACTEGDAEKTMSPDDKMSKLREANGALQVEVARLKSALEEARRSQAELQNEIERLKDSVSKEGDTRETKGYWRGILNTVLLSVAIVVLLVIAVRIKRPAQRSVTSENRHDCPRCGWTLVPGSTVCGNPDCRTRLG